MTKFNGWGRALAAIGAGALVLWFCSIYACAQWAPEGCHYWSDFAHACFQRYYWAVTGSTTGLFLALGCISAALVWLFLAPGEERVDRHEIADQVLGDAMRAAKARTPVAAAAEVSFRQRFWRQMMSILGR